jgi:hypothetical protein
LNLLRRLWCMLENFLSEKNYKKNYLLVKPQLVWKCHQSNISFRSILVRVRESELQKNHKTDRSSWISPLILQSGKAVADRLCDLCKIALLNSGKHWLIQTSCWGLRRKWKERLVSFPMEHCLNSMGEWLCLALKLEISQTNDANILVKTL